MGVGQPSQILKIKLKLLWKNNVINRYLKKGNVQKNMYYKHSNYKKVIKVYIGEIEKCQNNHFQLNNKVKK